MDRITIYTIDDSGESVRLSWFDRDAATHIAEEARSWNGNNWIGVISGLQIDRAQLYRTAAGRWVENINASNEFNGANRWAFLNDEEARNWLMRAEDSEKLLEEWFPDTPDEAGPDPQGGRPAVGPAISVAYPPELLERIGAAATAAGQSRAQWLRNAAEAVLTVEDDE